MLKGEVLYEMDNKMMLRVKDELAKSKLFDFVEKYYSDDLEILIHSLYKQQFEKKDAKEVLSEVKRFKYRRTKKRWANKAIKDYKEKKKVKNPKELLGEYHHLNEYQMSFLQEDETPEDRIESSKKRLEQWIQDDDALLSEYMYLHQKTKNQQRTAIEVDVAIYLGDSLLKFQEEDESALEKYPNKKGYAVIDKPLFGSTKTRGSMALTESDDFFENSYDVEGDTYKVLVDKDYVNTLNKQVHDLDGFDYRIFTSIMSKRDESFIKERAVTVKLRDIVNMFYETPSTKNHQMIEERLIKMANFRMTYMDGESAISTLSLFDVTINKKTNEPTVRISLHESMYSQFINNQTFFLYHDKVEKLDTALAYQIIMILQQDRLASVHYTDNYQAQKNYIYFCGYIRFQKRKTRILKDIEDALEEIVAQGIVLKSFYRVRDVFHLEYYPVEEAELNDFITNSMHIPDLEKDPLKLAEKSK